jgi:hypothetical protein
MKTPVNISATTYKRLCIQGYGKYSQADLAALRFGIRLPYALCVVITAVGLLLVNIPILASLMFIAFLGVILPNHPIDYVYNFGLRQLLSRPQLPPRTAQIKFACGLATFWLAVTIILFWCRLILPGIAWGSVLIAIAGLVSTSDICIPSMIYNRLTEQNIMDK